MDPVRVAILTISDGAASGRREDRSGAAIAEWAGRDGRVLVRRGLVPDHTHDITARLLEWCDAGDVDLILTTGGTGFTVRDVTPEATLAVIERSAPGLAEAIRARGATAHPHAMLSRGLAGIRARTLVVNLPGSMGGVNDGLAVLEGVLAHAVQLLRGVDTDRHPAAGVL